MWKDTPENDIIRNVNTVHLKNGKYDCSNKENSFGILIKKKKKCFQ